jgi:hypothetical protein
MNFIKKLSFPGPCWLPLFVSLFLAVTVENSVPLCHADDIYTITVKKQEDKDRYRWSLSDWFSMRDRMRIQDLWLAIHSPTPYEFILGGNYQFDQQTSGPIFTAWEISLAAYATIFGLEARYESFLDPRWQAMFDLRIFGFHDQGTHITLQAGLRSTNASAGTYRNIFGGVNFAVYLARFFGLSGRYYHYFPSTPIGSGISDSGDRFQGGAFIEFSFLQIYGDYFGAYETTSNTNGIIVGIKTFF